MAFGYEPARWHWIELTLQAPISAGNFLSISTADPNEFTNFDSLLAIYDSSGNLVAPDDDTDNPESSNDTASWLWAGANPPSGVNDGATVPTLPAGTYYVAVSLFGYEFLSGF